MNISKSDNIQPQHRLPGEVGIWVFVACDMILFGLLYVTYVFYHVLSPELFISSKKMLSIPLGVLNTLLLLTSSLCIASAITKVRDNQMDAARQWIGLAMLCGFGFIAVKFVEWGDVISHGITIFSGGFYLYYFMYTGIHMFHLILGMVFLLVLWRKTRMATCADVSFFEIGATFWHMVDLLWIMLFAILYLMK